MSGPSGPNNKRAAAAKPKKSTRTKNVKVKAAGGGLAKAADSGPSGPNNSDGN